MTKIANQAENMDVTLHGCNDIAYYILHRINDVLIILLCYLDDIHVELRERSTCNMI